MKNYLTNALIIVLYLLLYGCQEESQSEETITSTAISAKEISKDQRKTIEAIHTKTAIFSKENSITATAIFAKEKIESQIIPAKELLKN